MAALQRRVEAAGLMFTVLRRGHEEGGLIFIKWVDGREATLFTEATVNDARRWVVRGGTAPEFEINERVAKDESFDPDLWVVEILGSSAHVAAILDPVSD